MKLNLGCSTDLRGGGWTNVDMVPLSSLEVERTGGAKMYQIADLALPWQWEDSSVEEIYAADIFEHIGDIPRIDWDHAPMGGRHWSGRIHVMNESWRVLRPGGTLTMECPDAAKGSGQWQDPTHVTPWTPNALQYFADGSPARKRFAQAYGITARFKILGVTERRYEEWAGDVVSSIGARVRCEVWKFQAILEAVKP